MTCTRQASCHLFIKGLPCRSRLVSMDTGYTSPHISPHSEKFIHKPLPQTFLSLSLQSCSFQVPRPSDSCCPCTAVDPGPLAFSPPRQVAFWGNPFTSTFRARWGKLFCTAFHLCVVPAYLQSNLLTGSASSFFTLLPTQSTEAIVVGCGGMEQVSWESQPPVHVTYLCFRDLRKADSIVHIDLPAMVECGMWLGGARHTQLSSHTHVGSGIWSLPVSSRKSGAVVQMENSYLQKIYLCSKPLRICAMTLLLGSARTSYQRHPGLELQSYLVNGSEQHTEMMFK